MILNENMNKKTDEAWSRLHNRLKQDGLLTAEPKRRAISPAFTWSVAVFAALCVCISVFYISQKTNTITEDLLTLQNDQESGTLVKTLNDGSVVYLNTQTSLQYPKAFKESKREVFLQGDAFFDIAGNPGHPFVIDTRLVQIEVLGTAFNVKCNEPDNFSLSVLHGLVRITMKDSQQSFLISQGQTAEIDYLQQPKISQTEDINLFSKYTKQMHFKDEILSNIVKVINANSEDSVLLKIAPEIANRSLTVTFDNESSAIMAQLISMTLGLQYKQEQNVITLSK